MNIKHIKALADILQQSDLSVLEVAEGENRIRLERTRPASSGYAGAPKTAQALETPLPIQPEEGGLDFNDLREVKSPMVGVFYSASSPGAKPFVSVGDKVKKGDVLCIIEAMKLMNELTSDYDGGIVDICVADGDVVEFGQTIFKIC